MTYKSIWLDWRSPLFVVWMGPIFLSYPPIQVNICIHFLPSIRLLSPPTWTKCKSNIFQAKKRSWNIIISSKNNLSLSRAEYYQLIAPILPLLSAPDLLNDLRRRSPGAWYHLPKNAKNLFSSKETVQHNSTQPLNWTCFNFIDRFEITALVKSISEYPVWNFFHVIC